MRWVSNATKWKTFCSVGAESPLKCGVEGHKKCPTPERIGMGRLVAAFIVGDDIQSLMLILYHIFCNLQAFFAQNAYVCRSAALPGLSTADAACQGLLAVHFTLDKLRTMAVAGQCEGRSRSSGKIGGFTIFWTVNCGKSRCKVAKSALFAPGADFVLCDFCGADPQTSLTLPESPAGTAGGGRRGEATDNRTVAAMDEGIKIAPLPKQRGYCQSMGLTAFAAAGTSLTGIS